MSDPVWYDSTVAVPYVSGEVIGIKDGHPGNYEFDWQDQCWTRFDMTTHTWTWRDATPDMWRER